MTPDILDTAGAAEYLAISCPTLERLRLTGNGPQFAKLTPGNRGPVRYRRADLDAWIASRLVRSTSETVEA
ncbi:DNA-binding protein [Novosphingobium umbonatum]|uniref:DNA-binding protein n=1 Tax=Novosphingobium umbonatum TaxID=1908524 RepID=A0A3S2UPT8_9SPHN|nr:helix-turn-helix domain-containing protein [Novosphingobium umbonatum]RVU03816.1 DNA-binding protein [Novosphingobium umbonatum]